MDKIFLNQMKFYGYHGVLPEETKLGQPFIVDVVLELDLSKAGQADDLNETVNYADVYHVVKEIIEGRPYELIETVAEQLATVILTAFEKVQYCTVKVTKPHPPIQGHYDSVAVEIRRERL